MATGLLDLLVPGIGQNPFYQAFDQNRGKITGAFSGMAGAGNDPRMALQGFVGGLQHGVSIDQENAIIRQQEAEKKAQVAKEQQQQNQTIAMLQQKAASDPRYATLLQGVQAGIATPADAFNKMMALEGGAVADNSAPATVQEWQYFSNLPPEQQAAYLRMKRANPYLDIGTGFVQPDPVNPGQTAGSPIAKDNFTPAYDKAAGDASGKAAIERINQLPQQLAKADNMLGTIDGILNDPALDYSTGWLSWMQGVAGTDQYRFGQRALQLQGQAFLQAFESLRGGGQITQIEGEKATQAIGRLSTSQSPQDYRAALEELKTIINGAKVRTQQQAAGLAPNPYGASAGTGAPIDYRTYFGGQ